MEQQGSMEDVREQFEQWRLTRKNSREPIPASLWQSAVALTKTHSINAVARALRLNGDDLKRKMPQYGNPSPVTPIPSSDFIELTCDLPVSATACTVELVDQKGSSMRISMKGHPDVPGLIQSFWQKDR